MSDQIPKHHPSISFVFQQLVFLFSLFSQAAAQLLSASMVIYAFTVPRTSASSILLRPWFIVLVGAGAIERLFGVALGVAMERDWVVLVVPLFSLLFSFHVY